MNIYIPIEVKNRELESKVLLALEAASKGHQVLVGVKSDTTDLIFKNFLKPGIIHLKSIQPNTIVTKFLKRAKLRGFRVTTQDEESGLLDEKYDDFANQRFGPLSLAFVDKVFCWGKHDYQSLRSIYPMFSDKFINTGSPRVDFWKQELFDYYKSCYNYNIPSEYVLIISNFGTSLSNNSLTDFVKYIMKDKDLKSVNEEIYNLIRNYSYSINLTLEYISTIKKLAEIFIDKIFVLRPHPTEDLKAWKLLLGDTQNIKVIHQGSAGFWINNAKIIILNGCTTAFEAIAMGKNVISYRPLKSAYEREIPNKIIPNIFNFNLLKNQVKKLLNEEQSIPSPTLVKFQNKTLRNRFSNYFGVFAYKNIVKEWEGMNNTTLCRKNNILWIKMITRLNDKFGVGTFIKSKFPKLFQKSGYQQVPAFPILESGEINHIVHQLKITINGVAKVKYTRIGRRSFLFYL